MFNRELQVRMVKTNKSQPERANQTDVEIEGKVAHVAFVTDRAIKKAAWAVVGCVALTAVRDILVAKASK